MYPLPTLNNIYDFSKYIPQKREKEGGKKNQAEKYLRGKTVVIFWENMYPESITIIQYS